MARLYFFILSFLICFQLPAQVAKKSMTPQRGLGENTSTKIKYPNDKGAVLWSDDFSTPANWTMTGGTPTNWTIGATASGAGGFPLADLVSTTAGNGWALFDSDGVNTNGSQDASITTATSISTLGFNNIAVVFENYFRPFSTTAVYLEISTDGVTFPNQYQVHGGIPANGATLNPETTTVNISAAGGNQPAIWIRFRYTGDWDYGWAVDDVEVQVLDDNDLALDAPFFGFGSKLIRYSRMPSSQQLPISFSMNAVNNGAVSQPNTILTADVNGGLFLGTSNPSNIIPGQSDSLVVTTTYTPSSFGVPYFVNLSIASDSVDGNPIDNSIMFNPFEISFNVFALDTYSPNPMIGGGLDNSTTPPSAEFEVVNAFEIVQWSFMAGIIEVYVAPGTPVGTPIEGVLYDSNYVQLDRSWIHTVTAAEIGTFVGLNLPSLVMPTGKVFAGIHTYTEFNYGVSGIGPDIYSPSGPTSFISYPNMVTPNPGQEYYTTEIPMIRLLEPPGGIESENGAVLPEIHVYPNPVQDVVHIKGDLENYKVRIIDVAGKGVSPSQIGTGSFDVSHLKRGVYFLQVEMEEGVITKKFVKQ